MAIVTLLSDWKPNDFYLAALKGKLLGACQNIQLIDIAHGLPSFNLSKGAFILRNAYPHYPPGTIHLICINSEFQAGQKQLVAELDGQYFVGGDNGIFGMMLHREPDRVYALDEKISQKGGTFPELTTFVEITAHLAQGKDLNKIASQTKEYQQQTPFRAAIDNMVINGSVIYIDSYQNAITNISRELFSRIGHGKAFDIFVQSHHYRVSKINKTYRETTPGELLAIFNSLGLLEIAINKGNVAELLNLVTGSGIMVKFKE